MTPIADTIASAQEHPCSHFISSRLRVGLMGLGKMGQAVVSTAISARDVLRTRGIELQLAAALVRDPSRHRSHAQHLEEVTSDPEVFLRGSFDAVVEVMGGVEPARTLVTRVLESGTPVVTANKSLIAVHGDELCELAARQGTCLRYEASVLASVPFLGALARRPLASAIHRVSGIINGTTNFILSSMTEEALSYPAALEKAVSLGLAEPDPASDVRGIDAAEKLAVLLQQFGPWNIQHTQLETTGIQHISAQDLAQARAFGGVIKPIAYAAWDGDAIEAFVGPAFLREAHPLARIDGRLNGLCLRSSLAGDLFYSGPGAGPDVTAATILDDVVEIAQLRYAADPPRLAPIPVAACHPPRTGWFVRLACATSLPSAPDLADFLGSHRIWIRQTSEIRHEVLYVLTHPCSRCCLADALAAVRAATGCETSQTRVLEG